MFWSQHWLQRHYSIVRWKITKSGRKFRQRCCFLLFLFTLSLCCGKYTLLWLLLCSTWRHIRSPQTNSWFQIKDPIRHSYFIRSQNYVRVHSILLQPYCYGMHWCWCQNKGYILHDSSHQNWSFPDKQFLPCCYGINLVTNTWFGNEYNHTLSSWQMWLAITKGYLYFTNHRDKYKLLSGQSVLLLCYHLPVTCVDISLDKPFLIIIDHNSTQSSLELKVWINMIFMEACQPG